MKQTINDFEKALKELYDMVLSMAEKGKIKSNTLQKYIWFITVFKTHYERSESDAVENQMTIGELNNQIEKLKTLLQLSGITAKGVEQILHIPSYFLTHYLDIIYLKKDFLQSEIDWDGILVDYNAFSKIIDSDVKSIKQYRCLSRIAVDHPQAKEILVSLKKTFQHLNKYFSSIDKNQEVVFPDLKTELIEYYVK